MRTFTQALLCLLLTLHSLWANNETWTSAVGSEIQGRYLGTSQEQYWILSEDGRLFKLNAAQLSSESRSKVEAIEAKFPKETHPMAPKRSILVNDDVDSVSEQTILQLASTRIPNVSFQSVSVASALQTLSKLSNHDLEFRFSDPNSQDRQVSIQLRNLACDQILNFILTQVGLYYEIEDGIVIIHPQR